MSDLFFKVGADYEEVIRLKEEIASLTKQLKNLGYNATPDSVKKLETRLAQCKKEMQGLADKAAIAGSEIRMEAQEMQAAINGVTNVARRATGVMTGLFAASGIETFVSQVVRTRGEMQQLEVGFKTMLGSADKANALLNQLVDTAATTPFDLQGVANGAKQLLAYGTASEEVNDTLVKLGDIAAGLSLPLSDMVYLYGTTMTQGRMFTQDLRQFQGRGIPLAEELAKQFGVAKDEVSDLVTKGKVGAEEFKKAIESMASAGGQFGGLMSAQSKTISGQISNLEDSISTMFNDIGKASEGIISDSIEGIAYLAENYKEIGSAIMEVVAAYGVYKGTLMAISATQKATAQVSYAAEMEQLQALLPTKEKSKDADLEALVAKGKLSKAQAEQIIQMRTEAEAHVQLLQAKKAEAEMDEARALTAAQSAQSDLEAAEAMVSSAQERLETAKALGNAEEVATAEKELNTAAEIRNSAAKENNNAKQNLSAATQARQTAATQADTAATNLNTVAKKTANKVSIVLRSSVQKLWAAMMANPLMLVVGAVTALGYAIYKVATSTSELEDAQNTVRDGFKEAGAEAEAESVKLSILKGKLDAAKEGTQEYKDLKSQLIRDYGKYDETLKEEIEKVGLTEEAYSRLNAAIRNTAMERQRSSLMNDLSKTYGEKVTSNMSSLRENIRDQYKENNVDDFEAKAEATFQRIRAAYNKGEVKLADERRSDGRGGYYMEQVIQFTSEELQAEYNALMKSNEIIEDEGRDIKNAIKGLIRAKDALDTGIKEIESTIGKEGEKNDDGKIKVTESGRTLKASIEERKKLQEQAKKDYEEAKRQLEQAKTMPNADAQEVKELEDATRAKKKLYDRAVKEYEAYKNAYTGTAMTHDDYVADLKKQMDEAKKALDDSRKNGESEKNIQTFKTTYEEAKKKYEAAIEKSKTGKESDAQKAAEESLQKMLMQLRISNEKELNELEQNEHEKTLKNIDIQYREREAKIKENEEKLKQLNKDAKTKGVNKATGLTTEQEGLIKQERDNNEAQRTREQEDLARAEAKRVNDYLKQWGNAEEKRAAIISEYDKQIAESRAKGDDYGAKGLEKQRDKDLANLDFEQLKNSEDYSAAFSDLGNTATITLESLRDKLTAMKGQMAETFTPTEMREYMQTIQNITDEITSRNPFSALKLALEEYNDAQTEYESAKAELSTTQAELEELDGQKASMDEVRYTTLRAAAQDKITKATERTVKAANAYQKAQNNVGKAFEETSKVIEKSIGAVNELGQSIGGVFGEVTDAITSIVSLVTTSISGMQTASEAGSKAMQAVERASVILAIISAAYQIIQKLSELVDFGNDHDAYEAASKKQQELNDMQRSVRDYEAAVLAAQIAEKRWFSQTGLTNLQDNFTKGQKALENYYAKANEQQEKYVDQAAGRTGFGKMVEDATKGVFDPLMDTLKGDFKDLLGDITAVSTAGLVGKDAFNEYQGSKVSAMDNLRIETREREHGTWFRKGHAQETQDLRTWVKDNLGADLFDEENLINIEAAQHVLDKYGEKLQGETQATLEQLIAYREQWDEYIETLNEYVSNMYSPVVDNMTDALMNWLDTGEDVLDSFQASASQTFRNIAQEMVKDMVMKNVFGSYEEDMKALYADYAKGGLTTEDLAKKSAALTGDVIDNFSEQQEGLKTMTQMLSDVYNSVGIDISNAQEDMQEASRGAFQTMSEDTAGELNGRFTALQISGEQILSESRQQTIGVLSIDKRMFEMMTQNTLMQQSTINIQSILAQSYLELQGIRENTAEVITPIKAMDATLKDIQRHIKDNL